MPCPPKKRSDADVGSELVIGDWGGSRLRLWRILDGEVVARREGPGMIGTANPAAELSVAVDGWAAGPIILCGMAGARDGLLEATYLPCPVSAGQWVSAATCGEFVGRPLRVAAGVSCRNTLGRPDVMRGEETQIFGALTLDPTLAIGDHWVVLPGTHSKWVRLKDGTIAGLRTFVTGELFRLLQRSSLLAFDEQPGESDIEAGLSDGLARRTERSELTSTLFEARAAQLCDGKSPGWASGFVSGLLIGAEIAEMAPEGPVIIIGAPRLAARYAQGLAQSGITATLIDGETCAIAGLRLLDAHA